MLAPNSVLRRLPPGLNATDLVFLDGIRHSLEIAELAFARLRQNLTAAAAETFQGRGVAPEALTALYLDAWAFVDNVDRFRLLITLFPSAQSVPRTDGGPKLKDTLEPIRQLRNVADHLAQRVEFVASQRSTVLGELSWCTMVEPVSGKVLSCVLVPGTMTTGYRELVNPAGLTFDADTIGVHLSAGGYRASLSVVYSEVARRIPMIEQSLEASFRSQGADGKVAGADFIFSALLEWRAEEAPA